MKLTTNLGPLAAEVRMNTDGLIAQLIEQKITEADDMSTRYGDLWRSVEVLAKRGGKRIRPYIVNLAYHAYGGTASSNAPLLAGGAVELLHLALLVHDDVIDRDFERYGVKNVSGQYLDRYSNELLNSADKLHFANSAAIMAGDLLIAEAHYLISQIDDLSPELKRQTFSHFNKSVFAVCGGELLDTESAFLGSPEPASKIAELKTASYSFANPLLMGATMANAPTEEMNKLQLLAGSIGIAYQLRDDLLGIFGDQAVTGKTSIGDIREGKKTFMIEYFFDHAASSDIQEFIRYFGNPNLTSEMNQHAIELLVSSGAKKACEVEIDKLAEQAYRQIDELSIDSQYRDTFAELVRACLKREK